METGKYERMFGDNQDPLLVLAEQDAVARSAGNYSNTFLRRYLKAAGASDEAIFRILPEGCPPYESHTTFHKAPTYKASAKQTSILDILD